MLMARLEARLRTANIPFPTSVRASIQFFALSDWILQIEQ